MKRPLWVPTLHHQGRNVALLSTGVLVAQFATILATPIITRLYSTTSFGAFAIAMAIVTMFAPVSALRFELSIPLTRTLVGAWHALTASLISIVVTSLTLGLFLYFTSDSILLIFNFPDDLKSIHWWIPWTIAASGLFQALTYWALKLQAVKTVSAGRAVYGLSSSSTQVGVGVFGFQTHGLIVGELFGRTIACIYLVAHTGAHCAAYITKTSVRRILLSFYRFRGFALLATPSSFVNSVTATLPVFFLGFLFGPEIAGLYFLAQRVAGLPNSLLVSSNAQAFLLEATSSQPLTSLSQTYTRTLFTTARFTAPLFILIAVSSPFVFPAVFGSAWSLSGIIASLLTPMLFLQLLSGSTIPALDVVQAHRARFLREIMFLFGTLSVLFTTYIFSFSEVTFIAIYSAFCSGFYLYSLFWVHSLIKR